MLRRWRYGLGVDLVVSAGALEMCAISVIVISGLMRVGLGWPAVFIVLMGVGALAVSAIGLWYTIGAMREARDGDVRERGSG